MATEMYALFFFELKLLNDNDYNHVTSLNDGSTAENLNQTSPGPSDAIQKIYRKLQRKWIWRFALVFSIQTSTFLFGVGIVACIGSRIITFMPENTSTQTRFDLLVICRFN